MPRRKLLLIPIWKVSEVLVSDEGKMAKATKETKATRVPKKSRTKVPTSSARLV
jgi:hypothetical protein